VAASSVAAVVMAASSRVRGRERRLREAFWTNWSRTWLEPSSSSTTILDRSVHLTSPLGGSGLKSLSFRTTTSRKLNSLTRGTVRPGTSARSLRHLRAPPRILRSPDLRHTAVGAARRGRRDVAQKPTSRPKASWPNAWPKTSLRHRRRRGRCPRRRYGCRRRRGRRRRGRRVAAEARAKRRRPGRGQGVISSVPDLEGAGSGLRRQAGSAGRRCRPRARCGTRA
jgi:hypothetical protein